MKVTGAPPPTISPLGSVTGSNGSSPVGEVATVNSLHLDTARHGVDPAQFVKQLRSSHDLAQMLSHRQTGATDLRNSMIRDFGADTVLPLFNDQAHGKPSGGER